MNRKPLSSIILCLCLFGVSCTPEKRLARLVEKHPELAKTDTVWAEVKYFVPEIRHDTSFFWSTDTVILEKDRLRVEIHTDTVTKRIKVYGACLSDTVYQIVPKYITTVSPVKSVKVPRWNWFWWGFVFGILVCGVIGLTRLLKR